MTLPEAEPRLSQGARWGEVGQEKRLLCASCRAELFIWVWVPRVSGETPEPPYDKQAQARPQLSQMN